MPVEYVPNNRWSGYCWLDPIDVFEFLGFMPDQYELSPGLQEVRDWFLKRLQTNIKNPDMDGVLGDKGRKIAKEQIEYLSDLFVPKLCLEF